MSADERLKWIQALQHGPVPNNAMPLAALTRCGDLSAFVGEVSRFNASQPNASMLEDIRSYNHFIVGEFDKIARLRGATILDIGASPHGYAMEKCFELGVSRYVGIGLDIERDESVLVGDAEGHLLYMNAEDLAFADRTFDLVVSMSTFEHIGDVPKALSEIDRVMKPRGKSLISFEPLWTCAYGHHLHHLEGMGRVVPPWSHLVWGRRRMREHLEATLSPGAAPGVEELLSLIFDDGYLNRIGVDRMREIFGAAASSIEWMMPMMHEAIEHPMLAEAARATGLSAEDLHTKGLSVLLNKSAIGIQ